jgi:hypothetical protein
VEFFEKMILIFYVVLPITRVWGQHPVLSLHGLEAPLKSPLTTIGTIYGWRLIQL